MLIEGFLKLVCTVVENSIQILKTARKVHHFWEIMLNK